VGDEWSWCEDVLPHFGDDFHNNSSKKLERLSTDIKFPHLCQTVKLIGAVVMKSVEPHQAMILFSSGANEVTNMMSYHSIRHLE